MRSLLVTTLVVLLLAAACGDGEEVGGPATPGPTGTPDGGGAPTEPTEPTAPTEPADDATPDLTDTESEDLDGHETDDVAVVVDADGRVVVLDASTGEEVRELLDDVRVDDPASNDIAVSPDGSDVYVVVPPEEPPGSSSLVVVPTSGGEPQTIAEGAVPAVSPEGGTLAYVAFEVPEDSPVDLPDPVLVLRDLDSGEEMRLSREEPFHFIPDVEWTADGAQVVFTAGEIHTGLYVIDRDAASLDEARRLGPEVDDTGGTTSWGPVAAYGEEQLAVVETCCDVPREERYGVITVDVADGAAQGDLLPEERVEATHLDSDAEAAALLIVVGGGPDGGELLRWDGDGSGEPLAERIIVAAW